MGRRGRKRVVAGAGLLLFLGVALAGCFHPTDEVPSGPLTDAHGEPLGDTLHWVEVATGLGQPTALAHAGDGSGDLFVTEQSGVVRRVTSDGLQADPVLDIRERVGSRNFEEGLLGLAFHPDSPQDERVFVSYTDTDRHSVVSWFPRASGDGEPLRLDPDQEQVVLRLQQPYGNHNGGQIKFGPDGYFWLGLGDGGSGGDPRGHGQNTGTLLGSMLRIDVDAPGDAGAAYGIPPGNPFADGEGGAPEIFAYGLRNPWRFSFDRETGDLWIADVGQNRWEEVNRVPAGAGAGWNFGWNRYEGHERYSDARADDPVFPVAVYPIQGHDHCAVTGGYVYRGEAIPALVGVYLFGDWCSGMVWGLQEDPGDGQDDAWFMGELMDTSTRPSSFGEDETGELYLVDHQGALLRLASR